MKTTITITIDGEHITVSTGSGGGAGGSYAKAKSNEAIPAGGSPRQMPGRSGLAIGEAPMKDLEYWQGHITKSLDNEPSGRFAGKNREDLDAIGVEIDRRRGVIVTDAPGLYPPDESDLPF